MGGLPPDAGSVQGADLGRERQRVREGEPSAGSTRIAMRWRMNRGIVGEALRSSKLAATTELLILGFVAM